MTRFAQLFSCLVLAIFCTSVLEKAPTPVLSLAVARATCLSILIFLVFSGCSKKEDVPHAATLERNKLMAITFPASPLPNAKNIQEVALPEYQAGKGAPTSAVMSASVTPIYVVRLDSTHAVMLTHTMPVGEGNEPMMCHACPNYIGAYFFALDEAGWRLTNRQDGAATVGVEGSLGKTAIKKMGENEYAFSAEWGSCWQGYCGNWLVLLGLHSSRISVLSRGIPVSAENTGAYQDCWGEEVDDATSKTEAEKPAHECFDVNGDWKIEGEKLRVDFRGQIRGVTDNGQRTALQKIRDTAIYGIKDGKFVLEKGINPVPQF